MSFEELIKSAPAEVVFLYRLCNDGYLSRVVRRKQLPKLSLADLKLASPLLAPLEADQEALLSQQTVRDLHFKYPYSDSQALANAASLSHMPAHKSFKQPQTRKRLVRRDGSLRDKNDSIVEQLEISRNHIDLVRRRKELRQPLPPLHMSFTMESPTGLSPYSSTSRVPVPRKFTIHSDWSGSDFRQLGLDQHETARKLRTIQRKKLALPSLNESKSLKLASSKQKTQRKMSILKSEADEVKLFLQEEFQKKMAEGYLSKLKYVGSMREQRMLTYRGLELI